jgi:hypothetical protein
MGCLNIQILDVQDTAHPKLIGSFDQTNGLREMALSKNEKIIFATTSGGDQHSFKIIDISNPSEPKLLGQLKQASLKWQDSFNYVALSNDEKRAYLTTVNALYIVDISIPTRPKVISHTALNGGFTIAVATNGKYAYVSTILDGKIIAIDVSKPSQPRILGAVNIKPSKTNDIGEIVVRYYGMQNTPAPSLQLRANDSRLYFTNSEGLITMDVSDPEKPITVNVLDYVGDQVANYDSHPHAISGYSNKKNFYVSEDEKHLFITIDGHDPIIGESGSRAAHPNEELTNGLLIFNQ